MIEGFAIAGVALWLALSLYTAAAYGIHSPKRKTVSEPDVSVMEKQMDMFGRRDPRVEPTHAVICMRCAKLAHRFHRLDAAKPITIACHGEEEVLTIPARAIEIENTFRAFEPLA